MDVIWPILLPWLPNLVLHLDPTREVGSIPAANSANANDGVCQAHLNDFPSETSATAGQNYQTLLSLWQVRKSERQQVSSHTYPSGRLSRLAIHRCRCSLLYQILLFLPSTSLREYASWPILEEACWRTNLRGNRERQWGAWSHGGCVGNHGKEVYIYQEPVTNCGFAINRNRPKNT